MLQNFRSPSGVLRSNVYIHREAFAWAYKLAGRPVKRRGLPTAPVLLSKLRNLLPGGKAAPARCKTIASVHVSLIIIYAGLRTVHLLNTVSCSLQLRVNFKAGRFRLVVLIPQSDLTIIKGFAPDHDQRCAYRLVAVSKPHCNCGGLAVQRRCQQQWRWRHGGGGSV